MTIIDTERRVALAQILLPGSLGFAQADGNGRIYITVSDRSQILRLDAEAMGSEVQRIIGAQPATRASPTTSRAANDNFYRRGSGRSS